MRLLLLAICVLSAASLACSDADDDIAVPTSVFSPAQQTETPPSQPTTPGPAQPSPAPPSSTAPPAEDLSQWDADTVWQGYNENTNLFEQCLGGDFSPECVIEAAQQGDASRFAVDFIQQNETVLVSFEEMGVVDIGNVAWLALNMNRPELAFLNGDFGLIHYRALIPQNWKSGHPSYEELPGGEVGGPLAWAEYSAIAQSTSDSQGQTFVVETPVQECRACAVLAYLALEVSFTSEGALDSVLVLPMRCQPEALHDREFAEGPCT